MQWISLNFETTHEASELIAEFLLNLGAEGVDVVDPEEIRSVLAAPDSLAYADSDFFDQLDQLVRIHGYFVMNNQQIRCRCKPDLLDPAAVYDQKPRDWVMIEALERMIQSSLSRFRSFMDIGQGYTGWQQIRQEQWADNWKKYYQTHHLTSRLVINPSWLDYLPKPGEVVISLDPGSAFGTGTHESTALCAELLDEMVHSESSVLDLGTGSGILAIIASRLGARRVEAIDIDPSVIQTALDNCEVNHVSVDVHTGTLADASAPPYNLIVANIIADVLIELMPDFPAVMTSDGQLVLSGIIEDRQADVQAAIESAGLRTTQLRKRKDWCTLVVCQKADSQI